jgi:hypothetical protein
MAKKTTKKAPSKKAPRMSASAARAEGAARQKRMRDAAKSVEAVHTGTVIRGDGKAVTVTVPKDDAPAPKARGAKQPKAKATKPANPKRVSLLDAAAKVLAGAKAPMQAKQIVDAVVERGLWKAGAGKTPHATLYAAMTREIAAKGKDTRFRKVDRGQFAAGKGA